MAKRIDKTEAKRAAWIERTAAALALPQDQVIDLLRTQRQQSVRLNTLKSTGETSRKLQEQGLIQAEFSWAPNCYSLTVPVKEIRNHPFATSGQLYIQNAASWLPVLALAPKKGEKILDMCAAPGGKSSHIAALCDNDLGLWVNDNSRPRVLKMKNLFSQLSVQPQNITMFDARQLASRLNDELFDKILLDAPCSGEGLMHLDSDKDFATWSVAHIKRLQQLQKRLISQAWQLLKPGGTLVYSTCTMAPEENEAVVDYLLRRTDGQAQIHKLDFDLPNRFKTVSDWNAKHFDNQVSECLRLAPSTQIEAFFVCKITKDQEV